MGAERARDAPGRELEIRHPRDSVICSHALDHHAATGCVLKRVWPSVIQGRRIGIHTERSTREIAHTPPNRDPNVWERRRLDTFDRLAGEIYRSCGTVCWPARVHRERVRQALGRTADSPTTDTEGEDPRPAPHRIPPVRRQIGQGPNPRKAAAAANAAAALVSMFI